MLSWMAAGMARAMEGNAGRRRLCAKRLPKRWGEEAVIIPGTKKERAKASLQAGADIAIVRRNPDSLAMSTVGLEADFSLVIE